MAETTEPSRRRFWGWCRCSFRWARITILGSILLVLALLTWLRFMGLPTFVSSRIVDELAVRGIAADFESVRFHWFRGLVARNLRVAWGGTNGPRISVTEADLDIAPPPWDQSGIIRGLSVRRGDLVWPVIASNEPARELRIDTIAADVRFHGRDTWEVRRLAGKFMGFFELELSATITNVADLRGTRRPTERRPAADGAAALSKVLAELEKWSAPKPPRLELNLEMDGRDPWAAHGDVFLRAPRVDTPHGTVTGLRLSFRAHAHGELVEPVRTSGVMEIDELQTPHGGWVGLAGRFELEGPTPPALATNANWNVAVNHLFLRGLRCRNLRMEGTSWLPEVAQGATVTNMMDQPVRTRVTVRSDTMELGRSGLDPNVAANVVVNSEIRHSLSSELPEWASLDVEMASISGPLGSIGATRVRGEVSPDEDAGEPPGDLGFWEHLWPFRAQLDLEVENVRTPKLSLDRLETSGDWDAPVLAVGVTRARLYQGELHATGSLDVVTRKAALDAETTFDLHGIDPLLGPTSRENFERYQWEIAPWFKGRAQAVLPVWTDPDPDWDGEVKPTVRLEGQFRVGRGAFKGVPFDRAESSVSFDGQTWYLPDLRTARPEGSQEIVVIYNEDTREYRIDARGVVSPPVLKPILGEQSAEILDLFQFPMPVTAEVSVWGPWSEGNSQSIRGKLQATNFIFREKRFDHLAATVAYTNRLLLATPLRLDRQGGVLQAEAVAYDFEADRASLTNVVNTIDPMVIAASLSPSFPEKLAPYRFDTPPRIRVQGTIHPRDTSTADLVFDVEGGAFRFWRFATETVQTRMLWKGSSLTLTNLHANFYRGVLEGNAIFDISDPQDAEYRFNSRLRAINLGDLLREATTARTNSIEGRVDMDLTVTSAKTSDVRTWNGYGSAELHDGLLWDVPIFGFLSPVLNGIIPGIGNNRAERASATFTVTNGVIHTRDLAISCPPAKLLYRGTVDFDQRVDAKVEALVLEEVGGIGPLFSLLLRPLTKLLEFRVTGTLAHVEAEPLYVPKFMLFPLQPVKTLRDFFGGGHSRTNQPSRQEPQSGPQ